MNGGLGCKKIPTSFFQTELLHIYSQKIWLGVLLSRRVIRQYKFEKVGSKPSERVLGGRIIQCTLVYVKNSVLAKKHSTRATSAELYRPK